MTSSDKNTDNIISDGSYVLVVLNEHKRWVTKVESGKQFHCHKGFIEFDEVIGKPYGIRIFTSKSTAVSIYKPLQIDFLSKISHSSQIIYPKDAGLILLYGDIKPGSRVIETGTGSGGLTSILASYVRPNGHIYSYENREQAFKTSTNNIKKLGLNDAITLKLQDAIEGFDEEDVDAIVLDLASPEEIIPHAYSSLRSSGTVSIFIPTYNQIERTYHELKEYDFGDIICFETIKRELQLKTNAIRPQTRIIGHTGFLIFARKRTKMVQK
ncbi:MAG: tRNA (adenine-N1)-methyltransferase [Candidatus Heimdallarchaeota archaeon]|nr:tRNA (adenine-N1)-methyltransferase [Candidatus Heimdallarchaeota archaeon]MCK4769214.1 tRNA (adenine-N1)-methyltransferase [Candidatus Heimdallarchaeota archaeon]